MQITRKVDIISAGSFSRSVLWKQARLDIEESIWSADWPHGSGSFSLNPTPSVYPSGNRVGQPDKHPNGVKPIKVPILLELEARGWTTEDLPPVLPGQLLRTGDLDALLKGRGGAHVGFEWETGNVSSSHRAIAKLLDALYRGTIRGGFLAVPDREMSRYLTDRVGNYEELNPYFEHWSRYPIASGALRIYSVKHDNLDDHAPYIPKGISGRALG